MGYGQGNPDFVYLPHWEYLGGQAIDGNAARQAATIPNVQHQTGRESGMKTTTGEMARRR